MEEGCWRVVLDHGLARRIMFADFFQDFGHFLMETFGRMPLPTKATVCRVIIQCVGNVEVQNLGHGTAVDAAFFGIRRCGRKWRRSWSKIVSLGDKANILDEDVLSCSLVMKMLKLCS